MRIGIDLGGTKIEIAALDDAARVVLRERIASPSHDYEAIVEAIGALVERTEAKLGTRASIGIGTPGVPSRVTGAMKNSNTVVLNGRPLADDLRRRLGCDIRIANDANCFALAEAVYTLPDETVGSSAARDAAAASAAAAARGATALDARVVFGVILGTGVGGGVVVDGKVLDGVNGIAGEWGHNPLPLPGPEDLPLPACYCGRHGCIETYLSGPGFAARHAERHGGGGGAKPYGGGIRAEPHGDGDTPAGRLTAPKIVERALAGDAACRASFDSYVERLARSLAIVINVLDPDAIVLGGGLSNIDALYDEVPRRWGAHVFSDTVATRLVRHRLGDSAGVIGAALLWP